MNKHIIGFTLIIGFFVTFNLISQPPPPDPGGGVDPTEIPFGGLEILLAVGGALGIKKIISKKKNQP